ncbi:DHHA1 domain-containing protein, partial [Bacillus sp. JJ1764]
AIKILNWERQRKKVRLQFVCGERVIQQLAQKQTVLLELTKLLNAPEHDMPSAAIRLLETNKALEKSLEQAKEALIQYEAKEILEVSQDKLVAEVFKNRSIQELQKLARAIIALDEEAIVLAVSDNQQQLQLVCARGNGRNESMKKLIGSALPLINGKGGGNDSFAQGGGPALISAQQLLEHLRGSAFIEA